MLAVGTPSSLQPCFLVEWYGPESSDALEDTTARLAEGAGSMTAEGSPVQVLMTLAVPTEDVVFAVLAADTAQTVTQMCRRAGLPALRITPAVGTRLTRP